MHILVVVEHRTMARTKERDQEEPEDIHKSIICRSLKERGVLYIAARANRQLTDNRNKRC